MSDLTQNTANLANEEYLDFSRQSMLRALELFFEHTKYSLTLLLTVLTGVLAIAAFSFEKLEGKPAMQFVYYVEVGLLLLMGPIALVSYRLVARYYKLYVSCYVYAARLHCHYQIVPHPWFVEIGSRVKDLHDQSAVNDFITQAIKIEGHSWSYYRRLIALLGSLGVLLGTLGLLWLVIHPLL